MNLKKHVRYGAKILRNGMHKWLPFVELGLLATSEDSACRRALMERNGAWNAVASYVVMEMLT